MLAGLHVDHAALDRASTDLATTGRRIDARLDQLDTDLAPLRSKWGGSAQQSYKEAKSTWDTAMTEMVTLLRDISTAVDEANQAYRAADQRGSRRFS